MSIDASYMVLLEHFVNGYLLMSAFCSFKIKWYVLWNIGTHILYNAK